MPGSRLWPFNRGVNQCGNWSKPALSRRCMNLSCNFSWKKKRTKDAVIFNSTVQALDFWLLSVCLESSFCEFEGIGSFIRIANSLKNQQSKFFAIEYKEVGCLRPCPPCFQTLYPQDISREDWDWPTFFIRRYTLLYLSMVTRILLMKRLNKTNTVFCPCNCIQQF